MVDIYTKSQMLYMKRFEEYSEILNSPLHEVTNYENLTESEAISILGGRENYDRLIELNYPIHEGVFDMLTFFDGLSAEGASKRFTMELIAGLISPLAKKLNIVKGTILWYLLLYGTQHALMEIGTGIFDKNRKNLFCEAFVAGAIESTKLWATGKVVNKLGNTIMRYMGHGGGTNFLDTTFGVSISNSFRDLAGSVFKEDIISKYGKSLICNEEFIDVNGKKQSLWDAVVGMGEGVITGILGFVD